jgi:NAD(P)-dependent dehydrogenase (short-subunit alcohol dehydrogenase family)
VPAREACFWIDRHIGLAKSTDGSVCGSSISEAAPPIQQADNRKEATMTRDRVAMISGGNRGIGAAIARRLSEDGWRLSLGMREPQRPAWATEADSIHLFQYEATAKVEENWAEAVVDEFGRIDAVIPNAGIMIAKSVIEADEDDLDAMLEINVKAPRRLVKATWSELITCGAGRVVIIASLSGKRVASARSGLYSMSKYAVVALAHSLRHEGWKHGIRCTAVCPGLTETEMGRQLVPDPKVELTDPEDIARLVSLAVDLRNSSSLSELYINCNDGEIY